jgi:hypothetical protein
VTLSDEQLGWLRQDLADAASERLEVGDCIGGSARGDMGIALIGATQPLANWREVHLWTMRACEVEDIFGFVIARHAKDYEIRGPVSWNDNVLVKAMDLKEPSWPEAPLWRGQPYGSGPIIEIQPGVRLRSSALAERL